MLETAYKGADSGLYMLKEDSPVKKYREIVVEGNRGEVGHERLWTKLYKHDMAQDRVKWKFVIK